LKTGVTLTTVPGVDPGLVNDVTACPAVIGIVAPSPFPLPKDPVLYTYNTEPAVREVPNGYRLVVTFQRLLSAVDVVVPALLNGDTKIPPAAVVYC
jgi:hypothetical protein